MNDVLIDEKYLLEGSTPDRLVTIFGNATIDKSNGYYTISSTKEGNLNKLLHRLIFEEFYQIKLPRRIHIHHNDENKQNNHIWNLIPLSIEEHMRIHGLNREMSEETRKKMSESRKGENSPLYGKKLSKERKLNLSRANNKTGYYRVSIQECKQCKQGFMYRYVYTDENGKQIQFRSISLEKLKQKVLANGLEWKKLDVIYDENVIYDKIHEIISKYFDPRLCGGVTDCAKEIYELVDDIKVNP